MGALIPSEAVAAPAWPTTRRCWAARAGNALPHLLAMPPGGMAPRGLVVAVHGISRNAAEHIDLLAPPAARHGFAVLAPLLSSNAFPRYQRLARGSDGRRPDHALIDLLDWVRRNHLPPCAPTVLVGYSGGAQFAHRFLLKHPGESSSALLGAAGWYTWPDPAVRFPYGVGGREEAEERLEAFLRKPIWVAVGSRDTRRDAHLRISPALDARQGRTRVARARNWTRAMAGCAARRGIEPRLELRLLPGARHSFSECVAAGLGTMLDEHLSLFAGHEQAERSIA